MRLGSRGTMEPGTFSRMGDTHRWYFKVNAVKEEEYPREYRGRCLVGRGVKGRTTKCRRPWDYRRSYSGYHNRTLRHAFFVAHLAWPLSRCAVQNGIFYVCESGDHQTKMHLGDCSHGGCSVLAFLLFFFSLSARIPNPGPPISLVLPIAFSVLSVIYFRNEESPEYLLQSESIRDAHAAFDRASTNVEMIETTCHKA